MREFEISPGIYYTNGKNQIRLVVDIGPQYNPNKDGTPGLNYCVPGGKDSRRAWHQQNISLREFAAWAQEAVK